jgi:hypothetical protein
MSAYWPWGLLTPVSWVWDKEYPEPNGEQAELANTLIFYGTSPESRLKEGWLDYRSGRNGVLQDTVFLSFAKIGIKKIGSGGGGMPDFGVGWS